MVWVSCILIDVSELRQRGRFAGFSLYISNTGDIEGSFLCYKNGLHLPLLNFTTTSCITLGRYVIFYNERLDVITYPLEFEVSTNVLMELCEFTVKGNQYTFGCIFVSVGLR